MYTLMISDIYIYICIYPYINEVLRAFVSPPILPWRTFSLEGVSGPHLFGRGFVDLLSCCLFEPLCVRPTVLGLRLGGFWDPWARSKRCFRVGKTLSGNFWACPLPHLFREPLLQGVRSACVSTSGSNLANGNLLTRPCAIPFSNSGVVFWSASGRGSG